jgi:hypothetical protein
MQSSLPGEPADRNIKAADIADSAEIAKIVAIHVGGALLAFWSSRHYRRISMAAIAAFRL